MPFTQLTAELSLQSVEIGNGDDDAPTTFSFYNDNRIAPILDARGKPIARANAVKLFGSTFSVLSDGVDVCSKHYTWQSGYAGDQPVLTPKAADLSDWAKAIDEPGFVLVDTQTGRFKFAPANRLEGGKPMKLANRVVLGAFEILSVKARGSFVYCAMGEEAHAILAFDFTDPAKPRYAGYSALGGYASNCAIGKTHAYGMTSRRQGHIADIRDPHKIKTIKTYYSGWSFVQGRHFWDLEKDRFYIYDHNGLTCYDTRDEDDPMPVSSWRCNVVGFEVVGDLIYGTWTEQQPKLDVKGKPIKDKNGQPVMFKAMFAGVKRLKPDGTSEIVGKSPVPGGPVGRSSRVKDGLIAFITSEGVGLVDARQPKSPKLLKFHLGPKYKYNYGVKWGMTDVCFHKDKLLVTCAADVSVGVHRGHLEYASRLKQQEAEISKKTWQQKGGLLIFDLANPAELKLIGQLSNYHCGFGPVTDVDTDDSRDIAYVYSNPSLCAVDIKDPTKPKLLSWLGGDGELNQARYFGDHIYAINSTLFVINPWPIEKAHLVGSAKHGGGRFGVLVNGSPKSNLVITASQQGTVGMVDISSKEAPKAVTPKSPWPGGYARWDYPYVYACGPLVYHYNSGSRSFSVVYRANVPGFSGNRVIIADGHLYEVSMSGNNKKGKLMRIWKIVSPTHLELKGELEWKVGGGWDWPGNPYFYKDFIFHGDLVIDVADKSHPKVVNILRKIREDIASYSSGSGLHYARDGILYSANYFTGLHVWDIRKLRSKNEVRFVGVWRDEEDPWSVASVYSRSVDGYGRYLFSTDFGNVNIYEIPTESDVPEGKLTAKIFVQKTK